MDGSPHGLAAQTETQAATASTATATGGTTAAIGVAWATGEVM
jgi:hypothetical protein